MHRFTLVEQFTLESGLIGQSSSPVFQSSEWIYIYPFTSQILHMHVLGTHATSSHGLWPRKVHTCAARGRVVGLLWCPSERLSFNLWKYSLLASMLVELRLIYVVQLSGAVVMSGTQNVQILIWYLLQCRVSYNLKMAALERL